MATITLPTVTTPAIVNAVEATMRRCFTELEQAERQGAALAVIERLYAAFLQATDIYKTACARLPPDAVPSFSQTSLLAAD